MATEECKPKMSLLFHIVIMTLVFLQDVAHASTVKVDIGVPPTVERYNNATLECSYDMEADKTLYSLKWYLNDQEIYRYMPKETPKVLISPNPNVVIIESESEPEKLLLKEVDLSATGNYKCEISRDWPTFDEASDVANMSVVVIPDSQPNIEGDVLGHYTVGNWVNLNCTAAPSIPPAAIRWLINGEGAASEYLREYETHKLDSGLLVSKLGLNFKLQKKDFIDGELKLKCTATIAALYTRSDEHSQQDPTAAVKEVRERPSEESLVTSSENTGHTTVWGLTSWQVLQLPLMAVLLIVNFLW